MVQNNTHQEELRQRMRAEFVLIIVHQLRTPLSNLRWMIKSFLDGEFGQIVDPQRKILEQGYGSIENMGTLIDDLLDIASLEEGKFLYRFSFVSMVDLVEKTVKKFLEESKRRGVNLIFDAPEQFVPDVEIDEDKMHLVLQNLLNNAIRYTPTGGEVTVYLKSDKLALEVIIQDTGIGIPKEQQLGIFSKFFRADNAIKIQSEGSGLGLFIAKNIIEKHGGKIWFESPPAEALAKEGEENKGTVFHFTIPVKS